MIEYLIDRDHAEEGGAEGALVKKYLSRPCSFGQSSRVCPCPPQPFPPPPPPPSRKFAAQAQIFKRCNKKKIIKQVFLVVIFYSSIVKIIYSACVNI